MWEILSILQGNVAFPFPALQFVSKGNLKRDCYVSETREREKTYIVEVIYN